MSISSTRLPLDGKAFSLAVVLTFCFGLQQVAIKAASPEISPMLQISLRSLVAGVMVLALNFFWLKEKWIRDVKFTHALMLGGFFAGDFFFVSEGLLYTTASHMAVLFNTAPLWAAVILGLKMPEERLSRLQWAGIFVAFAGIAATFLLPGLMGDAEAGMTNPLWWWGDLLGLLSGLCWGLSIVTIRLTPINNAPATQTLCWQLVGGFVILLPLAFIMPDQDLFAPAAIGWASMIFQACIVCVVAYMLWFWMLTKYLATRLSILSLMSPMYGVVLGVWLLNEPLHPTFLFGAALVFAGLITVQTDAHLKRAWRRIGSAMQSAPESKLATAGAGNR